MEVSPYSYCRWCGCSRGLGVICYSRWIPIEDHKNISRIDVTWTGSLLFWFSLLFKLDEMAILSKVYVLDNFKSQNSLKLSFTNIRGFPSSFVGCESVLESNFPDIFALCETNVEDSINSINFSLRGYFPLTQTDYYSYTWSCSLCIKGNWFCTWLISKKLRVFLHSYLAAVLLPFLILITVFFVSMVFDAISSNIDEVLSINPSANIFVFRDYRIHHKYWLTF